MGILEIFGYDTGSGCETGFYVVGDSQSAFHSFFGNQSSTNHHTRITCVGATGNGSDDNVSIPQWALKFGMRDALCQVGFLSSEALWTGRGSKGVTKGCPQCGDRDAVLWPFRAGNAWYDLSQV